MCLRLIPAVKALHARTQGASARMRPAAWRRKARHAKKAAIWVVVEWL